MYLIADVIDRLLQQYHAGKSSGRLWIQLIEFQLDAKVIPVSESVIREDVIPHPIEIFFFRHPERGDIRNRIDVQSLPRFAIVEIFFRFRDVEDFPIPMIVLDAPDVLAGKTIQIVSLEARRLREIDTWMDSSASDASFFSARRRM